MNENLKIYKIMYKLDDEVKCVHCIAESRDQAVIYFDKYIIDLKNVISKLKYYKPIILHILTYDIKLGIF